MRRRCCDKHIAMGTARERRRSGRAGLPGRPAGVAFNGHAQGARLNGAVRPTPPHLAEIGISVRARVVRVRIGVCVRACPRACLHVAPNYWATREPWTATVRSAQERARAPALPLKRLRGQNRLWSARPPRSGAKTTLCGLVERVNVFRLRTPHTHTHVAVVIVSRPIEACWAPRLARLRWVCVSI